jgi:GR25 family glycosyltransferase involved in LPS biosynthesis
MFNFSNCEKFVISLEHRSDRRENFFNNIKSNGFDASSFQWLCAIEDEDFGGLGCSKSHLMALTKFIAENNKPYCAIFEDDFQFRQSATTCESIIKNLSDHARWDVFLFAGAELQSFETGRVDKNHNIERVFKSVTASAYLLNRQYAHVLIRNLLQGISGMEKYRSIQPRELIYHQFALDRTWNRIQNRDQWFCTSPMLGHQAPSFSDIEKKSVDYSSVSA